MAADYDLVILGGTLAGREAAREARSWGARVALVEPASRDDTNLWQWQCHQIFVQLAHQHYHRSLWAAEPQHAPDLNLLWQQVKTFAAIALEAQSLDRLTVLGVDLCWGVGQFVTRPRLAVRVGDRMLEGHAYLIAMGAATEQPAGATSERVYTPETLFQAQGIAFRSVAIAGSTPTAVELAQAFNRLAIQTTLLVEGDRLLPQADLETARCIHYLLEAEGVRVIPQAPVTTLKSLPDRVIVSSGAQSWEADAVVLTTQPHAPPAALEPLALTQWPSGSVRVNNYLQTSHLRVFACGDAIGHSSSYQAAHEAKIAVKNALFWPKSRVGDRSIPSVVATDLPLARVGLTEAQARSRYGDAVTVLQCSIPSTVAHPSSNGFCKLLVHNNGQVLGGHLMAPHAEEKIGAIALAIRHRLPITALADVPAVSGLVHQWLGDRRHRNPWLKILLETWFNWRR